MQRGWKYILVTGCLLSLTLCGTLGCAGQEEERNYLFSWKNKTVTEDRESLFQTMDQEKLQVLFQYFSKKLEKEEMETFLKEAADHRVEVYLLTGEPYWALEESGENILEEVKRAGKWNRKLKNGQLKGVLFDVEPYLLDDWNDRNAEEIMDCFANGMEKAYQEAQKQGLEVILCIPYFYDEKGLTEKLERLIRDCCDGVAVMNYFRGKECEHIRTEAALAKKYEKELINIYELQEPEEHGLTEKNTYYGEGLHKVRENFLELKEAYAPQRIFMALHDYESVKEVIERE